MTEPIDTSANPVTTTASSATVADDHACAHCGYNLRGLSSEGRCPECFTPVARSLHGNLLRYADADWLERLRFATVVKLWNIALTLLFVIVATIVAGAGLPGVITIILSTVIGGIGVWASFMITTQEPRIALSEDPVTWRKAVRVCAVAGLIAKLASDASAALGAGVAIQASAASSTLFGVVAVFGEMVYLRRFALRVPNEKLANATRIVMWGLTVMSVVGTGMVVLMQFFGPAAMVGAPGGAAGTAPAPGGVTFAMIGLGCVTGAAGLVFGIWQIVLVVQYKNAFTEAVGHSRSMA